MKAASKSGEGAMDLKGDMAAGRSEGSATSGRESEHEGGSQSAAQFLARASGG